MSKFLTTILAFIICLFTNYNTAVAAINTDCSSRGCTFVLTTSSGVLSFYGDDGTSAGSLTTSVGSGQGGISASEGYIFWSRQSSTNIWIYNVQNGGSACSRNVGSTQCRGGSSAVFDSFAYMACGGSVKKIALDCSSHVNIITGSGTLTLTKDTTSIYALEQTNSTIATIVPPLETASSSAIDWQGATGLTGITHVNGTLYINGSAGIYSVSLPITGSSVASSFKSLAAATDYIVTNGTHFVLPSMMGDLAYLVPIADPASTVSQNCVSCLWVAISNDTWYATNGVGVNSYDFSNNFISEITGNDTSSWAVAYAAPTVVLPVCGDGTKNGTEICDGADLNGSTCNTLGFDYGTLACAADCGSFNTSGCAMNCGNGSIEAPEECDGSNLDGATCTSLGFDSGTLACSGTCTFDTTACVTDTCGNGQIDGGEDCDGSNLNGQTCLTLGHDAGTLSCSPTSCTFDTTSCTDFVCGNGNIEGTEECDGANLGGETCTSLGLGTGTLSCQACSFNTSGCTPPPVCGNGTQETGEECDDGAANSDTLPDACRTNCSAPACGDNVTDTGEQCDDGNLTAGDGCDESCQIEIPPTCGNNAIDDGEDCDGDNLDGQTCVGLGFTGGSLACNACSFNTAGCTNNPVCDWNGVLTEETSVDHPDLAGAALEKYTSNTQTLSMSCQISCLDASTAQVVAPQGSYCNVMVTGTDFTVLWHIYTDANHTTPATIRIPTDIAYTMTRFGGGHILLHDGEDIDIGIGENQVVVGGTQGTAEMAEFRNVHPDFQTPGNWYVIDVLTDAMAYCDPDNDLNCALLTAGRNGRAILNLDALGDLTEWNLKVDDKPSCSGCSQTSGTPYDLIPLLVFIGLLGFWLRFRPMAMTSKIRSGVSKRR